MCGIAGMVSIDPERVTLSGLKSMTDVIAYRGPDGDGHWISEHGKVGLGHRRLSIIDLSHGADQPMHYRNRYTIVFNGEIYNYIELRETLAKQGYAFSTVSDTEVLMALYDRDKEKCLQLLDGMFAFAIYDKAEQVVFCACDRFGEKPFFYSYQPGKYFLFGSELKELWQVGIPKKINNKLLYNYLLTGALSNSDDQSETFYEQCTRLPHSHYLKIDIGELQLKSYCYYDIDWRQTDHSITEPKASERFRELFYESVKRRLRSDVPVGSSLSGGLDSSLVVSVIDELKGRQQIQKTFSAVFPGFAKDERKYMDMVIGKSNVDPYFVTPKDEGMIKELVNLSYHQEEPYGSASIYVQYKVMQLAKQHNVTVLLDGQGADELLAGYHSYYQWYFKELFRQDKTSYVDQKARYEALHSANTINGVVNGGLKQKIRERLPFAVKPLKAVYGLLKPDKRNNYLDDHFAAAYRNVSFPESKVPGSLNEALYISTMKGGLQELLRYADRNSMAHSREVRLPFLSHELADFLFSLPSHFKIKDGWTKWIMRRSFGQQLPEQITWRKDKIGYEPPQKSWMEGREFRDLITGYSEILVSQRILNRSILNNKKEVDNNTLWRRLMAGYLLS